MTTNETALRTADSWLERWAEHVGSCRGGELCTCGLTRVRYEVTEAIQSQPVICAGCEGKPAPENDPCAVCGLRVATDYLKQERQIPRNLVDCLRIEARNAANPPTEYLIADDGGRMVYKPKPDQDMAELLDQAANRITADGATMDQLAYALGCIANPDWSNMTAEDARELAQKTLEPHQ